jgi:hypothetical protein
VPDALQGFWTIEEDAALLALYEAHGSNWSRIAKCLKVRIPHQCRSRFNILARGSAASSGSHSQPARKRSGSGGSSPTRHKKQRPVRAWEGRCTATPQVQLQYSHLQRLNASQL